MLSALFHFIKINRNGIIRLSNMKLILSRCELICNLLIVSSKSGNDTGREAPRVFGGVDMVLNRLYTGIHEFMKSEPAQEPDFQKF